MFKRRVCLYENKWQDLSELPVAADPVWYSAGEMPQPVTQVVTKCSCLETIQNADTWLTELLGQVPTTEIINFVTNKISYTKWIFYFLLKWNVLKSLKKNWWVFFFLKNTTEKFTNRLINEGDRMSALIKILIKRKLLTFLQVQVSWSNINPKEEKKSTWYFTCQKVG